MIDAPVSDGTRRSLTASLQTGEPTVTELRLASDDAQHLIRQQYQMLRKCVKIFAEQNPRSISWLGGRHDGRLTFSRRRLATVLELIVHQPLPAGRSLVRCYCFWVRRALRRKHIFQKNNPLPDKTLNALEENLSWITNHWN